IAEPLGGPHQRDGHDARRLADLQRPVDVEAHQRHHARNSTAGERSIGRGRMRCMTLAHVPHRSRLMSTLFIAQVCGSTAHSMSLVVGSIMAAVITGTNTASGLPIAVGALGTALGSWPLSRLMERSGRRPGLVVGYGLGVAGTMVAMLGMATSRFTLFLCGMVLFGVGHTSNLLARYAAADVSPGPRRGRAMGLIVWGASVGAVLGPN